MFTGCLYKVILYTHVSDIFIYFFSHDVTVNNKYLLNILIKNKFIFKIIDLYIFQNT
jgi:hypothetical protein